MILITNLVLSIATPNEKYAAVKCTQDADHIKLLKRCRSRTAGQVQPSIVAASDTAHDIFIFFSALLIM